MTVQINGTTGVTTPDISTTTQTTSTATITTLNSTTINTTNLNVSGLKSFSCRAWATFSGQTAGTFTPTASGNVASVQRTGAGVYVVTFTTPMPNTLFVAIAGTSGAPGYNIGNIAVIGKTVSTVTINSTGTTGTSNVVADAGIVDLIVIG